MLKTFSDSTQPSSTDVTDIKDNIEGLKAAEKAASEVYIKLAVEVSRIKDETVKQQKRVPAEEAWTNLEEKVAQLIRKGQDYNLKVVPEPNRSAHAKSRGTPLERLPLPTF